MELFTKKSVFLLVLFLLFVTLLISSVPLLKSNAEKDVRKVQELESSLLSEVIDSNVSYLINQDWCKAIVVDDILYSKTFDSTSDEECGVRLTGISEFKSFDEVISRTFDRIANVSEKNDISQISIERPLTQRTEHYGLSSDSIGIAFHRDCDFCRTRYVYSKNYGTLPDDISGEIKYIPVNSDWFRVEQDWN